jgi:wyosine [tRNA(Phe)-imidazoG37] synthetase (radical SAM superfamily)
MVLCSFCFNYFRRLDYLQYSYLYKKFKMATFLFDKTVFGPVKSRRLGVSLGINLLPNDCKLCSFDCLYCECGWNPDFKKVKAILPTREWVFISLEAQLNKMANENELPDVITFAGNGEPTLHPDFPSIIDDTILLRNKLSPRARIAVLSNSTMLHKQTVVEALEKVDDNILKLDSGISETIQVINKPVGYFDFNKMVQQLIAFKGNLIIQTLFIRGEYNGVRFDNTTEKELEVWIELIGLINPKKLMIYSIDRETPLSTLEKVGASELKQIASRISETLKVDVEVSV